MLGVGGRPDERPYLLPLGGETPHHHRTQLPGRANYEDHVFSILLGDFPSFAFGM